MASADEPTCCWATRMFSRYCRQSGIGTVSRREERQRTADSVAGHFGQRIRQQRVPIAIPPINSPGGTVAIQLALEGGNQGPVLGVDRAYAAKVIIMLGHGQHPLARHVLAAQHVFQKRNDVVRLFRAAERYYEQGIEIFGRWRSHC